ncbi:hypothetical protein BH23THE1_BH23THE1_02910 [soil metagenome]
MRDIFLLENTVCRWLRNLLKENGKERRAAKRYVIIQILQTQKYSIITESMDILTVRLNQSLQELQVCVRER